MIAIAVAALFAIDEMIAERVSFRPRRLAIALFPPIAVTMLCLAARLTIPLQVLP